MDIFISGSLAFDRIMSFPGKFSDHIIPERVHILNVCFNINGLVEKFGGTAGNIAYSLGLLGEKPYVVATAGKDAENYLNWLLSHGVRLDYVEVKEESLTASAYITTDQMDNQITAFSPGAMDIPTGFSFDGPLPRKALLVIAAGNKKDMLRLSQESRGKGIDFVFDPGQSIPIWTASELKEALTGAKVFISNDYELALTLKATGLELKGLVDRVEIVVTTRAEQGSEVLTKKERIPIPPARARRVQDPTGAGDAYRAGFIKGMALGLDLFNSGLLASVVASYAVEDHGTQEHSFTLEEVALRLKDEFGVTLPPT